jgi:DNA polymerase-3 subunit gamma/tau
VPETITSRTQRFSFRPIDTPTIAKHLRSIAQQEKIKVNDSALTLIALHGRGSMRDSISIFDQLSATDSISEEDVVSLLGVASAQTIQAMVHALAQHDTAAIQGLLQQLQSGGFDAAGIAQQLIEGLRQEPVTAPTVNLMEQLLLVAPAYDPALQLEVVLLKYALASPAQAGEHRDAPPPAAAIPKKPPQPVAESAPVPPTVTVDHSDTIDANLWQTVLEAMKQRNYALYAVLRMAQAKATAEELRLTFGFSFHKKRVDETRNQQLLAEVLTELMTASPRVVTEVNEAASPKPSADASTMGSVIQVMGGGTPVAADDV